MAKPQRDIRQLRPFLSMPKSGFVNKGRAIKYEKKVLFYFHSNIDHDFINLSIYSNEFELKKFSSARAFTVLARKSTSKKLIFEGIKLSSAQIQLENWNAPAWLNSA